MTLYQIGNIMKNRKILGYIIIGLSLIFIFAYLLDGIKEIWIPFEGLGFPYKSPSHYVLKLIYACIFLFSGIDLLKKKNRSWYLIIFSSIGMLISCVYFYFIGYVFRTTPLDLFFLEIPSTFILILFNVNCFIERIEIRIPTKRWMLLGIFTIINIAINYYLLRSL